ncbi:major facilitator superfamily transporter [Xylaria nigripes]|nr:major facilitator superfamily transporter [Xylaria nigripes]
MATDERTHLLARDNGGQGNDSSNGQSDNFLAGQVQHSTDVSKLRLTNSSRILLAGFLVSFTLGITQTPILYVFRLMECDIFYEHNPDFSGPVGQRCLRSEIDAGTAQQFSILGMSTSLSGVFNLFVCGYFIKKWGSRWSLASQTALLGLKVATQVIGVSIGGRAGEIIFQVCQGIGIIGGLRGYQLVLNTAVSESVAPKDRTAVFGRLQGSIMLGTAFGFLLGGVLGDVYGIRRPFEIAFFLFIFSTLFAIFFMPTNISSETSDGKQLGPGLDGFFAPLKVIVPRLYRLDSGKIIENYGLIFLASGIFLGVLASGYAPILLQMYATSTFHFGTTQNGYLMFGNSLIRGLFLLFMFPKIITLGRNWYNEGSQQDEGIKRQLCEYGDVRASSEGSTPHENGRLLKKKPVQSPDADEEISGTGFDLLFVRWSLLIDSLVTLFAGLSTAAWHVYLAAFLLPFASGSAPAAKGVMTEMCPPSQRKDAISAITLVESAATLVTQGLFGLIFATFAELGMPRFTFLFNAGTAVIGVIVLFIARFPPVNSERIDDDSQFQLARET